MTRLVLLTQFNRNYKGEHDVPIAINPDKVCSVFPMEKVRSASRDQSETVMTTFIQFSSETEQDYGGVWVIQDFDRVVRLLKGTGL